MGNDNNCLICGKPVSKNSGHPAAAALIVEIPDVRLSNGCMARWVRPLAYPRKTPDIPAGKICHSCWEDVNEAAQEEREESSSLEEIRQSAQLMEALGDEEALGDDVD